MISKKYLKQNEKEQMMKLTINRVFKISNEQKMKACENTIKRPHHFTASSCKLEWAQIEKTEM